MNQRIGFERGGEKPIDAVGHGDAMMHLVEGVAPVGDGEIGREVEHGTGVDGGVDAHIGRVRLRQGIGHRRQEYKVQKNQARSPALNSSRKGLQACSRPECHQRHRKGGNSVGVVDGLKG